MSETLRIRCGIMYDGSLQQPRSNVTLTVQHGTITAIGDEEGEHDLHVAALTPGLINAHVHLEASGEPNILSVTVLSTPAQLTLACVENARKSIAAGVTTVRDLGGTDRNAIDLRDAIAAGRHLGPTIFAAGKCICMTGGHGFFMGRETDGPWDARKAVREQLKRGANCIKLIATGGVLTPGAMPGREQLGEDEMRAAIEEATKHGLRVAAHAIGTSGIKNAIRAGVASIEHGMLIDEEGIALMKERGTMLVPTLNAVTAIVESGIELGIPQFAVDKARVIHEQMVGRLRTAYESGVRFAGGSDAGTPFNRHEDYGRELELMSLELGMSAIQTLHATTRNSAELLGSDAGRIEVGAPADLAAFDLDPASDIRTLRTPRAVVKGGVIVFRR